MPSAVYHVFSPASSLPTPQGDGELTLTVLRKVQETRKELPKK